MGLFLIEFILSELFFLPIVIVLILQIVIFFVKRAMDASRFVNSIINASVSYALAASIVEPSKARGSHTLTGGFTFIPGVTLSHVCNCTVHSHHVRLEGMLNFSVNGFWKNVIYSLESAIFITELLNLYPHDSNWILGLRK